MSSEGWPPKVAGLSRARTETSRPTARGVSLVAVVLLLLAPSLAQGAFAAEDPAALRTHAPVHVAGAVNETTVDGAAHLLGSASGVSARADAGAVQLDFRWREGVRAVPSGEESLATYNTDQGRSSPSFDNATIEITGAEDPVQLLAYPEEDGRSTLEAEGTGESLHRGRLPPYLVQVGAPPGSQSAGDDEMLSFSYEPADGWLVATSMDGVVVEGGFSLFVNNATVTIRQDDEVVWRNWTGYRASQDGVAAERFEQHMLHLHVDAARLSVDARDGLELFGSQLELAVTGAVSSPSVAGRLQTPVGPRLFDEDAIRLEGEGELTLATPPDSSPLPAEGLAFSIDPRSTFDVQGGAPADPGPSPGTLNLSEPSDVLPLAGLLIGLILAGAVVEHRARPAGRLIDAWRTRRYRTWMGRGSDHTDDHAFRQAAACFEKAARADPTQAKAWYYHALARHEDGDHEGTLDVIEAARESPAALDELEVLELEAAAAHRTDDHERVRTAVAKLAEVNEPTAASFVHDLGFGEEVLGPDLAQRLIGGRDPGPDRQGGGITGYV